MENHRFPLVTILTVIAVVIFLAGAIAGVAVGVETDSFLVTLGIWIGAFLSGILFLFAGEVLSHLENISSALSALNSAAQTKPGPQSMTPDNVSSQYVTPIQGAKSVPQSTPASNVVTKDEAPVKVSQCAPGVAVMPLPYDNDCVKCPACGATQIANRKFCYNCSVEFIRSVSTTENT